MIKNEEVTNPNRRSRERLSAYLHFYSWLRAGRKNAKAYLRL